MILPDLKDVERDQIPALIALISAYQSQLAAVLLTSPSGSNPSPADDHLIDIAAAAEKLSVSQDWLYRRADKLSFTVRMGNRLRFSSNGIDKYIQQRRGRT